jgi:hypothetical protein
MDVHIRFQITDGLMRPGIDVLTAQKDGAGDFEDGELLTRAGVLGRTLFRQDTDLLAEAVARQRQGIHFGGVIYAHQLGITIRQCIDDLELIAKAMEPDELIDCIIYLPLR